MKANKLILDQFPHQMVKAHNVSVHQRPEVSVLNMLPLDLIYGLGLSSCKVNIIKLIDNNIGDAKFCTLMMIEHSLNTCTVYFIWSRIEMVQVISMVLFLVGTALKTIRF